MLFPLTFHEHGSGQVFLEHHCRKWNVIVRCTPFLRASWDGNWLVNVCFKVWCRPSAYSISARGIITCWLRHTSVTCRIPNCDLLAAIISGLNRTWSVVRFVATIRIDFFFFWVPRRINGHSRMGSVVGYILSIWCLCLRLSFFLSFCNSFLLSSVFLLIDFKQTHAQLGWCLEGEKSCVIEWSICLKSTQLLWLLVPGS